ncbi:hypothetical protein [Paenibacillus sp. YYML68]|uniref:hypothetical protein n=1 Tax=Paenibacillus sp. YYML68 TaxID=2909250 RepID=UPI002493B01C|nr:hypothetical protein [Paenibacillus sp. YYML68]
MWMKMFKATAFALLLTVGSIALLFALDPTRVLGWAVNPANRSDAERFLSQLAQGKLEGAATALSRDDAGRQKWLEGMQQLRDRKLYLTGYERLTVPFDRDHMDGRAQLTFIANGQQVNYEALLTFAGGVNQVCIIGDTELVKEWNKVNCHD